MKKNETKFCFIVIFCDFEFSFFSKTVRLVMSREVRLSFYFFIDFFFLKKM